MTPQQLVGLAVRLFAIWLVVSALQVFGLGRGLSNQPGLEATNVPYFLAALILLLAAVLWVFPLVVANRLIPRTKFENVLRVPAEEAVTVAAVIFALWIFLFRVLPSLAHYISLVAVAVHNRHVITDYEEFHYARLLPIVIQLLVAVGLAFKARAISKYFLSERVPTEDENRVP